MTTSTREAALAALFGVITAALSARTPAPTLLRNETIPQRPPPGGLVVLRDGETLDAIPILGLAQTWMEHQAMVEIHAPGATEPDRRLLMDSLLRAIGDTITANPSLGGAVDAAAVQPAQLEDSAPEGAAPIRSAALPIALIITAPHPHG